MRAPRLGHTTTRGSPRVVDVLGDCRTFGAPRTGREDEPRIDQRWTTMTGMDPLDRISIDPEVLCGQPVIKGTRLPVYVIVEAIAAGDTVEDVLEAYPFLTRDDVRQALHFAARLSEVGTEVAS